MKSTMATITNEAQLLGPPELYKEDLTTNNQVDLDLSAKVADPIVNDDDDNSPTDDIDDDDDDDGTTAVMGLTENCSATFLKTGNPCLDFFFHILPDTPKESLIKRLELAWKHNPLMTLKLICHLRGVRGTGKSDKEGFYVAALWLHENHPNTLALNVKWFAEFGYLKDLVEILYRLLDGLEIRKEDKTKRENSLLSWKRGKRMEKTVKEVVWRKGKREIVEKSAFKAKRSSNPREKKRCKKDAEDPAVKLERLNLNEKKRKEKMERDASEIKTPKILKKKKIVEVGKKALQKYANDPNYRVLYEKISDHFAELLVSDIKFLKSKQYGKIGLAAKWCPSLDSSYDRATLICESIARKVFPRASYPEYEGIEEAHYAYRVRDRLRKDVLAPLRQALELPEIYMTAKKWDSLPYQRVASVAMKLYKRLFMEHDSERFSGYLQDVSEGKAKIAAGALLPHEIVSSLDRDGEDLSQVAELQWKRMVEDLSAKGTLNNCIAVCDVSGSMYGLPMEVCIALGLLISELSSGPWKGKVITFSEHPTLQIVKGDSLAEKKQFVANMHWGMNTDFQKVFDLLLAVAVKGKLDKSKMIKRIFVFSDMEFDQASTNDWETDYQVIQKKFNEQGYGSAIPEMVFWNLRDSRSIPVAAKQNGAALVSGYSKNILNLFLEGDGPLNPEVIMESAISGPEYNNLHVFD